MVPADHHRGADLSLLHQVVERATERGTLALSQPADAGGQSLEGDTLPGEPDPARQVLVLGEQLAHQAVGTADNVLVAAHRDPTERPLAFPEQRPDVLGDETRAVERLRDTGILPLGAAV